MELHIHQKIESSCFSISLSLQSYKNRSYVAQSQLLSSLATLLIVMQNLIYLVL